MNTLVFGFMLAWFIGSLLIWLIFKARLWVNLLAGFTLAVILLALLRPTPPSPPPVGAGSFLANTLALLGH
jgi:multisubunit Na+/H+ antiporter MnhE subunit